MRQSPVVFGVTVLTLGILSVTPGICANEASEVDTNSKVTPDPFARDSRVSLSLPLQVSEDLTYGAVTESPSGEPSASELNRQLTNPVSSIWSISNQFNNFELNNGQWNNNWNFQPVLPVGLTKDWNLITRPVMPFYNIVPHETSPGEFARDAGLGDLALVELLSPAHSGNWVLGAGPYLHLPDCDLALHWPGQMAGWAQCRGGLPHETVLHRRVPPAMVVHRRPARPARYEPDEPATHRRALLRRGLEHLLLGQYPCGLDRAV